MNIELVIDAIARLSWLLVIGAVVVTVIRASRGQGIRGAPAMIISTITLAVVLNIVGAGLEFIQPTERGVVITVRGGGVRPRALQPGLRWVIPFAETVVKYPVSRQTYTMSAIPQEGAISGDDSVQARTSDGQIVFVDASVIFAIDPNEAVEVHKKWLGAYVDNLLRPQARGIIRDQVALFRIDDVYSTRRDELSLIVEGKLREKLEEGGFILQDFVLRNIAFSPEYADSVEQKQIAEQQAFQAAFVVQQREQEAEQARKTAQGSADAIAIQADGNARALLLEARASAEARLIKAEAEAEALRMLAEAIEDNPDVLTLEYIQKISPSIRVMLLPSNNPLLLQVPGVDGLTSPSVP